MGERGEAGCWKEVVMELGEVVEVKVEWFLEI